MHRTSLVGTWALLAAAASACTGDIMSGEGAGPGDESTAPAGTSSGVRPTAQPGGAPATPTGAMGATGGAPAQAPGAVAVTPGGKVFRRLTLTQYRNAIRDLLGELPTATALEEVKPERENDGEYTNMAAALQGFDQGDIEAAYELALGAARGVFASETRRAALVGCAPASAADPCVRRFLESFGRRAFRRPLQAGELDRYAKLTATAIELGADVWVGLEHALAALLQSPHFLYVPELGEPDRDRSGSRRYTAWEMATRLSLGITNSIPDAELLDAAARGELVTVAGVRAQARRLLAKADGKRGLLQGFFREFFDVDGLEGLSKDVKLIPRGVSATSLATSMRQELERVLADAIATGEPFQNLLVRRGTFVNGDLAKLYGMTSPTGTSFQAVTMPEASERVGLLGQAALLALHAGPSKTNPPGRGKFVMSRFLCRQILPPPPDLDTTIADLNLPARRTKRMESDARLGFPQCGACHAIVDPIGLPMEGFDAIGAYRTTDQELPLDLRGALDGVDVVGLKGLAGALAKHEAVPSCLARQMYRYAAGRRETEGEEAELAALGKAARGSVTAVVEEVVASESFRRFVEP